MIVFDLANKRKNIHFNKIFLKFGMILDQLYLQKIILC